MRVPKIAGLGLCVALAGILMPASASADSASGTIYYTTFNGGVNVNRVNYNYNGVSLVLSGNAGVASTNGADGILFAPDGNLLVAGQGTGVDQIHELTPAGAAVSNALAGTGSYHMALSSAASNATLYNLWNGPGTGSTSISALTLSAGGLNGNGTGYAVGCAAAAGCSTDVRGLAFDPNNSTWYYGTAPDGSTAGTFGTVVFNDVTHTATLTQLMSNVAAHGLTFDSFTGDIIFSSAAEIEQYHPGTNSIVSTLIVAGNQFDQSAVDGQGHIFLASNGGNLEFIDYDATGLIGAAGNFTANPFLAANLDDIAPLSGAGSRPVPEPASLLLLGTGLVGLVRNRRRARK